MSRAPKDCSPVKQPLTESALPTRFLRMPALRARVSSAAEPATRKYGAAELAGLLAPAPRSAPLAPPSRAAAVNTVLAERPLSRRPRKAPRLLSRAVRPRWLLLIAAPLVGAALTLFGLSLAARRPHALPPHTASGPATHSGPTASAVAKAGAAAPTVNDVRPATPSNVTTERATAALAEGRYADALGAYRSLARRQPQRDAYAVIARILERRLQARCQRRTEAGGIPCSSPSD
jgi:hypothetical protein